MAFSGDWNSEGKEQAVILDEGGVTHVDMAYIREHPEWYTYIGSYRENGVIYHSFRLF